MSSAMMTRMFGFCCAAAGATSAIPMPSDASRPIQTFLFMLIALLVLPAAEVWLPDQFGYLVQDADDGACQEHVKRAPKIASKGRVASTEVALKRETAPDTC